MDYTARVLRGASALLALSTIALSACNSNNPAAGSSAQTSATPAAGDTSGTNDSRRRPRPSPSPSPTPTVTPSASPTPSPSPSSGVTFSDDFSSEIHNTCFADGASFGPWLSQYAGYGCNSVVTASTGSALSIQPQTSTSASQTHAGLVTGPTMTGDHIYEVRMMTSKQLRTGSAPNPWEVGWVFWNYTDDSHFYSVLLKPNGWELGKEDPAYPGAQRYLATGSSPAFPIGQWYDVKVQQKGSTITVWVNGTQLVTATDTQSPYSSGSFGLYDEDSLATFQNVQIW